MAGEIINGMNIFETKNNIKELEESLEYYRNYLLLKEGYSGFSKYYITFHRPLRNDEQFINIQCPHCCRPLNSTTMYGENVIAHSKMNCKDSLQNRESWGIAELVCPACHNKTVVVFE